MIAPLSFGVNPQTADSNAFQSADGQADLGGAARREALGAAAILRAAGIDVLLFDDTEQPRTPDAVFCNNWFSTHTDGTAVLYPMAAPNRRAERRPELLRSAAAARGLALLQLQDLSGLERDAQFLESTGEPYVSGVCRETEGITVDRAIRTAWRRSRPEGARRSPRPSLECAWWA